MGLRLPTLALAALVIAAAAVWLVAPERSGAEPGTMQNCPLAGKWSIAVWDGDDGTAAADALATCGAGAVDAAYALDPQTQMWSRWFAGKPEASNMPPLSDGQGVLALGSSTGAAATPTPSATPSATSSATATPGATATPTPGTTPSPDAEELSQQCFQAWTTAETLEIIIYQEEEAGIPTTYMESLLAEQDDFIQENCLSPSVAPVPDPTSDTLCEDVAAACVEADALIAALESEGVPHIYLDQHLAQLNTFYDSYCQ